MNMPLRIHQTFQSRSHVAPTTEANNRRAGASAMLEMSMRYTIQGVILAVGLCIAGTATAQESVSISAGSEQAQQASSETIPVAARIEADTGMSAAQSSLSG